MATTLTELFTDIANKLRKAKGTDAPIPAEDFASIIDCISVYNGKIARPINTTLIQNLQNPIRMTIASAITIKAATIYDGYIFAIGNDSNGDAYKLYGEITGNLTSVKLGNSRYYPATSISCDGTYVWIGNGSGAYSNRVLLRQTIDNFKSPSTSLNTYTSSTMYHTCVCSSSLGATLFFGSTINGNGGTLSKITNGSTSVNLGYDISSKIPEPFISCCNYNQGIVAITEGGYIAHWHSPTSHTYFDYGKLDFIKGAKLCRSFAGNQIYILTLNDNIITMYMSYYNYSLNPIEANSYQKIIIDTGEDVSDIVDMHICGNSVIMLYSTLSGETKALICRKPTFYKHDVGVCGYPVSISDGFNLRTIVSDGTNMCLLSDNGSTVEKAIVTGT